MNKDTIPDVFLNALFHLANFSGNSRRSNIENRKKIELIVMQIGANSDQRTSASKIDEGEAYLRMLQDIIQSINPPKEMEAKDKNMRQYTLAVNRIRKALELRRLELCLNNKPIHDPTIIQISRLLCLIEEKKRLWVTWRITKKKTHKKKIRKKQA